MEIQNLGQVGKASLETPKVEETGGEKKVGTTSEFEQVRTEQLAKEEQVTGLKVQDIQYNDNICTRNDIKQSQNDFLRKAQSRGEGGELSVLNEHIDQLHQKMDKSHQLVHSVDKSEFSGAIQNYFGEAENRFKQMDSLVKEMSAGDRQYSLQDLLKIQTQMQNISENVEVLSKVVDKVAEGMNTILRTQV